ncbi:MAG TPA: hypothetical protein VGR41_07655 [Actinomycetota bacterium]|jgi:hypothetical protein|nr:hypothetical protein [Actinomycetota bacterium]
MRRKGFRSAAVVAGFVGVLMSANAASAVNPPGNNGTVKIEGLDIDSIPDNDPHQGCFFTIEFRGYDEGDLNATYSLDAQPPSGHDVNVASGSVFIGEDPAGGANDLDATVVINLNSSNLNNLFEHPQQGFHLKLTVHAEGSIGADTKFKVFWVTGCPTYPASPTQSLTDLPVSLRTDVPTSSGIDWGIVGIAAMIVAAITILARRRVAHR